MKLKRIKITNREVSMVLLLVFSVFMIFPFFWLIRSSFMTQREIMTMPVKWIPSRFNFDNFIGAL
jgi:multiple sugar transport system permease protein